MQESPETSASTPLEAHAGWSPLRWAGLLLVLTVFCLAVHGYHPLSEDGGIYAVGAYLKLNPRLFPHYGDFVRRPTQYSQFATVAAAVVRLIHIRMQWVLFLAYLGTTWMMLFAGHQLLRRCTADQLQQLSGVALLAAWWTLPIAGTSLVLMDPYVTARSFSTPLTVLALAFAMDDWNIPIANRRWYRHPAVSCAICLLLAAMMHVLMAGYALAFVLVLRACMLKKPGISVGCFAMAAIILATVLQAMAPHESEAWRTAEITRYYWFLSQWHWYEIMGLIGPLIIFSLFTFRLPTVWRSTVRFLCFSCITIDSIAFIIALLFAREGATAHPVARLQPLRIFLPMYALMTLLLGAASARCSALLASKTQQRIVQKSLLFAPGAIILSSAVGMFLAQRNLYASTQHLELPWRSEQNTNPWVQAFQWAGANTPEDALFALDAHYITTPREDAQTFRAISLRDALPDYSKDGGEAAITGSLAPAWAAGVAAQLNLNIRSDAERQKQLLPFGVNWLVLNAGSATAFPCPYNNGTVKVCKLLHQP